MAWSQIASLRGDDGPPGPEPYLRVDSGQVQWRAGEDGTWQTLVLLDDLRGQDGEDGTGVTILGSFDSIDDLRAEHPTGDPGDAYLVAGDLYVWSDETGEWVNVGRIQGPPGEQVQLRVSGGHIQWRLGSSASWTDLIDVDELVGERGPRGTLWFTGEGSPGAIDGQRAGDLYLDTQSGTVYLLEG